MSRGEDGSGPDFDAPELLGVEGLPCAPALRRQHGRGYLPPGDDPARARAAQVERGVRAALAAAEGWPLWRAHEPRKKNATNEQPTQRPKEGHKSENPNRLQHYYQYQVIMKPAPADIQD